MANGTAEAAIRNYLTALRDPSSLRDDEAIGQLQSRLESSGDELERLQLRQQILDMETPSVERYEEEFVTHARAWADQHSISARAFEAEGVPSQVLRRAGFGGVARGGRRPSRGRSAGATRTRSRVTVDEVRSAIPKGAFTIKQLEEASGASPAVVRKVVREEVEGGRLMADGVDPDHTGPGRAPTLYRRGKK